MIFYFSATGNSADIANKLAQAQGDRCIVIPHEMAQKDNLFDYFAAKDEKIGFVFPVYAWTLPKQVQQFIAQMKLYFEGEKYLYAVCTCGDEAGNCMHILEKLLHKKGLHLDARFSVTMPNNCIVGFDVDPPQAVEYKLARVERTLPSICRVLATNQTHINQVHTGKFPGVRTFIGQHFASRFFINPKHFYADSRCNGCGLCQKVCPTQNITATQPPKWGEECTACLGCINRCPQKAIQYKDNTKNKGRYVHPSLLLK